jgi:uncharacterized protein (DUF305 family)
MPNPNLMRRTGPVVLLLAAMALGVAAERLWRARSDSPPPEPNLVDIRFAQFMGQHHQQALLLSQLVLAEPAGRVGGVARGIHTQQLLEAGQMLGWLQAWGQPLLPPERGMDWMLSVGPLDAAQKQYLLDCQRSKTGMAGLLDEATINTLRQARGAERDRLFLDLMRRHHEGGIPMARFAARHAATLAVRALAGQIVREQSEQLTGLRMLQVQFDHDVPRD